MEMEEEYIRGLLAGLSCPHCDRHYDPTTTSLLGHIEDAWVFYVYCPSCNRLGFAMATSGSGEVLELDGELTQVEKDRFSIPITSDDVIDMHIFLKGFSGSFSSLFTGR